MKKLIAFMLSSLLLFSLTACGAKESGVTETTDNAEIASEQSSADNADLSASNAEPTQTIAGDSALSEATEETMINRIRLTVNGETAIVELLDNDAAADFLSMLPLTVTFEDYNNTEKIATLPRELDIGGAPTSCDPDVGSFAYYAPWGNLSVFYEDFRESNSLIPLGTFTSGIDIFAETDGEFTVMIESEGN